MGPSLSLQSLQIPSPRYELSWNSTTNRFYQVQCCSDPSNEVWEDFQWPLAGTGTLLRELDYPDMDVPQRFFRFLCDYFHVSGYLGAAAPSCRPATADRWRKTQQARLRRGAAGKIIEALQEHLEPPGTAEELAPVTNAQRYLNNRTDCLDYPRALELGLPIGSGLIESGHRHVLQARLKKAGAAWLLSNAESIANLRVFRANGDWAELWN